MNLKDFQYVTTTCNENWFHGTGCQYPLVCPVGTKVKFICEYINYYGRWFEVEYEGEHKYIMPMFCEGNVMIKHETKSIYNPAANNYMTFHFYTDRYGKRYKLINEEGDLELL